jgi:hypothetical protein
MRVRLWVMALVLGMATATFANAQVQSGSISGGVRDSQGGVLPGATGHAGRERPEPVVCDH